jgi:uncharacterized protein (TIGR02646 family)
MAAVPQPGMQCDYASLRQSPHVLEAVEDGLLAEQGGLCAYTGHRIILTPANPQTGTNREVDFHIDHLTPQTHCRHGQDATYENLVACWPRPNCGFEPAYGARKKDQWPSPAEPGLFVSPLRPDCSTRFRFDHRGKIEPAHANDQAAQTTIDRLGLDHHPLTALRRQTVNGALNPASRQLKLAEARKLLAQMEQATQALNVGVNLFL